MFFDVTHRLRVLALVLAVLLPVKTLASVVIPITGVPGHHHDSEALHSADRHDAADHAAHLPGANDSVGPAGPHAPDSAPHCAAHATQLPDTEGAHEHGCPHLGMASICMAVMAIVATDASPRAASSVVAPPTSVVLDVPLPPPTA